MLVIPLNVKTIEYYAFTECSELSTIYYLGSEEVETLGDGIFDDISQTITIKVKNSFNGNTALGKSFTKMSESEESSGSSIKYFIDEDTGLLLFYGNGEMIDRSENGENGIPNYQNTTWHSKSSINLVKIESGITYIGNVLYKKGQMHTLMIANTVTKIGDVAFSECTNLKTLVLSDSLAYIGNWAFNYNQIDLLILPSTLVSIGTGAFKTIKISSLIIPSSVTSISLQSFQECNSLKTIYYYGLESPLSCSSESFNSGVQIIVSNDYSGYYFCSVYVTKLTKCD